MIEKIGRRFGVEPSRSVNPMIKVIARAHAQMTLFMADQNREVNEF